MVGKEVLVRSQVQAHKSGENDGTWPASGMSAKQVSPSMDEMEDRVLTNVPNLQPRGAAIHGMKAHVSCGSIVVTVICVKSEVDHPAVTCKAVITKP